MKRLVALCAALVLALVMAAPAVALEKVEMGPFPAESWEQKIDVSTCECDAEWNCTGWCEGWECRGGPSDEKRLWYNGEWSGNEWFWYKNNVDPDDYMPEGKPWPWIKGKSKGTGVDTYSTLPNKGGKVLSGRYNSQGRFFTHEWTDDWETWKGQFTGRGFGINAPGLGKVLYDSGNFRFVIEQEFEGGEVSLFEFTPLKIPNNSFLWDPDKYETAVTELCGYFGYSAHFED